MIHRIIDLTSHELSNDITTRLKYSRKKALTYKTKRLLSNFHWYVPATAFAVLLVYFILPLKHSLNQQPTIELMEKIDIIEDIEILEDLEFYEWLAKEQDFLI